ncbi:unnamed protein product [Caenorhabditis sp. 36 PRJEB53466]|nr:unnamed protein product [Caenorhabditis sp. 36 PRJEB53466]
MLYFEDALWLRENFWKNTIGTLYFALGFFGIVFHLILISILPDISNFISRPSVLLHTAQFIACILQFLMVFLPVPSMIAVQKPYFSNPVLINVPGFILVLAQTFVLILTISHGAHRYLRSFSTKAAKLIFVDHAIFTVIAISFCCSFCFAINICAHTTIRRFNPYRLSWNILDFEVNAYLYLIVVILVPTLILAALIYRVRGIFQPQSANSPIVIRDNTHGKVSKHRS